MSLPARGSLICGFDGINDTITVDGSPTPGNPYDFERSSSFTFAFRLNVGNGYPQTGIFYSFFHKYSGGKGYVIQVIKTGNFHYMNANVTDNGSNFWSLQSAQALSNNTNYIVATIYNNTNGWSHSIYSDLGVLISRANAVGGGSYPVSSIKNTIALSLGTTTFPGKLGHICIYNTNLNASFPVLDDLALKIAQDRVKEHSLYPSNCIGYWRQFMQGKVINEVDQTYNGTYSGFESP